MPFFPDNRRAALSWSFDDARPSQLDIGMPLLAELGLRASFYVSIDPLEKRIADWQRARAAGHEIGNHTLTHPCTANYPWTRGNALEDFTIERMLDDIHQAERRIEKALGIRTTTFAYPCGHTYVGRGRDTRSYVPLIAERFVSGRKFRGSANNDPERVDLAQTYAFNSDQLTGEQLKKLIDNALAENAWVIFAGHDIGQPNTHQTTRIDAIREAAAYCQEKSSDLWVAPIAGVASFIAGAKK
jgi:peptidoglycan/xylan/chitin deacetylase (PgdA/CDA1 family)